MRRRGFIAVLAGAAAWPVAGRAQQQEGRLRRLGVLLAYPQNDPTTREIVTALTKALAEFGWVEGKNIRIDYRFAVGDAALFKTAAAELIAMTHDVILASNTPAIRALREQTSTIPLVFVLVTDPVAQGFVPNLARPGGNITGFSLYDAAMMGKWVELLKEVAPQVTRVAAIFNPETAPYAALLGGGIAAAAPSFGISAALVPVHDDREIEGAVADAAREPGGSLISLPDSFNVAHRAAIIAATARHGLPLMGVSDVFPRDGGLISYGFDLIEPHVRAAFYIDRILKGASPGDLPIQQPTKYTLVVNLKTAKALGLTIPQSILARADDVVE